MSYNNNNLNLQRYFNYKNKCFFFHILDIFSEIKIPKTFFSKDLFGLPLRVQRIVFYTVSTKYATSWIRYHTNITNT